MIRTARRQSIWALRVVTAARRRASCTINGFTLYGPTRLPCQFLSTSGTVGRRLRESYVKLLVYKKLSRALVQGMGLKMSDSSLMRDALADKGIFP